MGYHLGQEPNCGKIFEVLGALQMVKEEVGL